MPDGKKSKKVKYKPKASELRKVLLFVIMKLEMEEIKKIEKCVHVVNKKHYLRNPASWRRYTGAVWFCNRFKEILNIRAGKPINDYRVGLLGLHDLSDLAVLVGMKKSQFGDVNRSIWWQQIVTYVKENEDSRINRLEKLWTWLAARIDEKNLDYLTVHSSVYWPDRECYKKNEWKLIHLSYIFNITNTILDIVDARLESKKPHPSVSSLTRVQLWVICNNPRIMDLALSNNATKEVMWKAILEKIEEDKEETKKLLKSKNINCGAS